MVELAEGVLERLEQQYAAGRSALHLQLLASFFYEASKREIGRMPADEGGQRRAVVAAANRCRRAATCAVTRGEILVELRAAVATLSGDPPARFGASSAEPPHLRVIPLERALVHREGEA
jgi:hypothetical protein